MSHFSPRYEKTDDEGNHLLVSRDGHDAWFVERPIDRQTKGNPLGAFRSDEAARNWADRQFPGGDWKPV